jgi:hypothetical protein
MVRSSVVLPDPFGPRKVSALPACTSKDKPDTTMRPPLWQARPSAAISCTAPVRLSFRFTLPEGSILAKELLIPFLRSATHLYVRVTQAHKTLFRMMMENPLWPL